jgi:hypothetical protein
MTSPLAARHTSGGAGCLIAASVGLEAVERRDRAEGLLLGDIHVGRHGQHRRLEEAAALGDALAAGDDLGSLFHGVGDVRLNLLDRLHVDERPDHGTRLEPVGDLRWPGGSAKRLVNAS